ncbi:MAG: ABC transporter ATP-binding protein, partial [Longicatena sp.]
RIAISRAFLRMKEVVLCDEITAALDNHTARIVERHILELKDKMVIYITHKLYEETLKDFDEIVVMQDGEAVEIGSFCELMNKRGAFYRLYHEHGQKES